MLIHKVEEIFVTEGVPQFTFVPPPNFGEILIDVRRKGKPVIIEGQSGSGKTTCIKKIIEQIGGDTPVEYLSARRAEHVSKIDKVVRDGLEGMYVIDDFHRLGTDIQKGLADIAKCAAEEGEDTSLPKLILIGINQIGSELIQLVPDIAKRTGVHRIRPGDKKRIIELIERGCDQLRVTMPQPEEIFNECKGDYWLTQQICQSLCVMNQVFETQTGLTPLSIDISKAREIVVDKLRNAYYPAVKEFCRGRRFRPTNDPYFKLLRTISSQASSFVDLDQLANSNPEVRGSINNIKAKRLDVLLEGKPLCAQHFYYNSETKSFAIEDPALFYFLRHLNWEEVRQDSGFRQEDHDYEFDFAISFAGENRLLAAFIAEQLSILDAHVFYDQNYESNFLGRAWGAEFLRIFGKDSRLVLCILDSKHLEKIWPTFERDCFTPRVKDATVIPIKLDETNFPGISEDIVSIYFDWQLEDENWHNEVIDKIIFPVMERLESL